MTKTSFFQKTALVFLGLVLTVVILEAGLRLGGFVLTSIQEERNKTALSKKDAYRILCLGESTTARQYPPYLEEILNEANIGIQFSVIDKGFVGTKTDTIVALLESNLDTYHPDMVITMMGVNDTGEHMPYEARSDSKLINFLRSCRVYKLARLLWLHLVKIFQGVDRNVIRAPSDAPFTHERMNELGISCRDEREFHKVLKLCKNALEDDPQNDEAYVLQGTCYREQGRFSEAEQSYKKAIAINAFNDKAYIELGTFFRKQSKYSEAEASYKKALEINPRNSDAYLQLGNAYRKHGFFDEAVEAFKKAIALDPNNDKAYFDLGDVYLELGTEQSEPIQSSAQGTQQGNETHDYKNSREYFERGRAYREQRKFPEAEEAFKKAIDIDPNGDADYYYELSDVYREQGKIFEGIEICKRAIEIYPEDYKARCELANAYVYAGEGLKASEWFKKAAEVDPQSQQAYLGLGNLYQKQKQYDKAEDSFKKAVELDPRNYKAYFLLGRIYQDQGRISETVELFKKLIKQEPENDKAYGALGAAYREMGNEKMAAKYSEKARQLRLRQYNPDTARNYRAIKKILDQKGIAYVCVQYPMRDAGSLKKIFSGDAEGIIFVDNEKTFKRGVQKEGYVEYFLDMFAGDFGHCTEKGNRLLARNIANVILMEVFNKKTGP